MSEAAPPLVHQRWDLGAPSLSLEAAIAGAEGFVEFRPGELSRQASPLLVYPGMHLCEHLEQIHLARDEIAPLGCRFLRNVVIGEHMLMFRDGRLLIEGSHLSDVSIQWANAYGIRADSPPRETMRVDAPVINVMGPGYLIYGHWLVDFLPRLAIAKALLGAQFASFKILQPSDTPKWASDLCRLILDVDPEQFLPYDPQRVRLECARVCTPTYAHGVQYGFHSFVTEMYSRVRPQNALQTRKLCISRKNFEGGTAGLWKMFEHREMFEKAAAERGYEIVYPETMGFADQIDLFANARVVLGEYGSALHNSVFSGPDLLVGAIRCPNTVQSALAAAFQQRTAYLIPESEWIDEQGIQRYACGSAQIVEFIEFVDSQLIST